MTSPAVEQKVADGPKIRRQRRVRVGVVASSRSQKTLRVLCEYLVRHRKYGKYMKRRTILHVHDEKAEAGVGDKVEVMECRPISKTKSWRLLRVLQHVESGLPGGVRA